MDEPCNKKSFTKRDAQAVVNLAKSGKRGKRGKEQRVYFCAEHNAWHTTAMKGYYK